MNIAPSIVRFADGNLKRELESLLSNKFEDKELHKWVMRAIIDLKQNAYCGIQIKKRLIPKEYYQKYKIDNLWKYDLPTGWRLLYSITTEEVYIVSIILEWLDHKEYDRRFGY